MNKNETKIDLTGMTHTQAFTTIITAYEEVYLHNCSVEKKQLSENEVLLIIENDLVVDFYLSDYSLGELILAENKEKTTDHKTIIIQELTPNLLFKFNYSAFRRFFIFAGCNIDFLKFRGINSYRKEIDRFSIVNKLCPELNMIDRYYAYPGQLYHFIIFEMKDINGNTGLGIGFSKNSVHKFVLKVGAELATKNSRTLVLNGSSSLDFILSKDFIKAFLSWEGKKKLWRLETQLTYYYIDIFVKEDTDLYSLPATIIADAKLGKHNHLERGQYKKPLNRWKTEELVYNTVRKIYKEYKVIYQYRPHYLKTKTGNMSYDVYICGLNIAIEYQGKQHFEPVEYFGGKEHYEKQVERDKLKLRLSKENGIKLVYINYWEDITPDLIIQRVGVDLRNKS
ncbi:MAG: hypothetical protein E7513_03460 [Ruminococcaceae bacterium]|nr:hypothetical protein [Oscillospiraceae bacterium]